MVCDRLFFFFGCFWPIYPANSLKNQNFLKMKKTKHLEISSFYTTVPKIMIISYNVPTIWHVMDVIIFHFGLFFAILPLLTAQKIKILKKMTKGLEVSSFYTCVSKLWSDNMWFLRYGMPQMDRQMQKMRYRGRCPTYKLTT